MPPRQKNRPLHHGQQPIVDRTAITGVGVMVTFRRPYINGDLHEGELDGWAEAVLNRIADATGSCTVVRHNHATIELLGQQDNPRVNTLEAIERTARGERRAPSAPKPRREPHRELKSVGMYLWQGPQGQQTRVYSAAGVSDGSDLMVGLRLSLDHGFGNHDLRKLKQVAAGLPRGEVVQQNREVSVWYCTTARDDVKLANEVGALLERLGKAF